MTAAGFLGLSMAMPKPCGFYGPILPPYSGNTVSNSRCYPTKYVNMWYRNDGAGNHKKSAWSFVDARTRQSVGPTFADRFELFAIIDQFAAANGYTEKETIPLNPPEPPKEIPAPQPEPLRLEPGTTVAALWDACAVKAAGMAPPSQLAACRAIFFAGFFAALEVFSRGGEDDVSAAEASDWLIALRRECRGVLETARGTL